VDTISRAWYQASVNRFCVAARDGILGALVRASGSVKSTERDAWLSAIRLLQDSLQGLTGTLFLEFSVPRMGGRIDAVVLTGPVVFVLEFKVGAETFDRSAIEQVWDYALDLKNFHAGSHDLSIAPLLIATEATTASALAPVADSDRVFHPILLGPGRIREAIVAVLPLSSGPHVDAEQWVASPYRPTPSIIEAARALYSSHSVEEITRTDAGAENLLVTSRRIEELISEARTSKRKVICFVTGVPGAGKTLVGLNVATQQREDASAPAVYLSGNGPLVNVLRAALARDEIRRRRAAGDALRKGQALERVKAFIQNVHHFRDECLRDVGPPAEHVAIFDEAQRAWTREMTANFMKRKRGLADFDKSEPHFLVSCMDRHRDWSVVVCLVGGGQEINTGEAGIDAWLDAVEDHFSDWQVHISSRLTDSEYAAGRALERARSMRNAIIDDCLHLSVSMRSFRSENVSLFVKALLDRESSAAAGLYERLGQSYPIVVTRDLDAAKAWLREKARGSERYGLVASSKAMRLKPYAVDVRVDVDPVQWFLNDRDDIRSSYYLEDAATEFQVQGLELEWAGVTWDADLRSRSTGWGHHDFRGSRWTNINKAEGRRYLLNAYRVLLTRARQGMVVFVPPGNRHDPTRLPEFYDETFAYLRNLGMETLT
jgi:Schlafen group 3, DNA/RNA helicase domain